MASTLDTHTSERHAFSEETVVAVVEAAEFEAARNDPRVRSFLDEADAYLVELEQQGRNR